MRACSEVGGEEQARLQAISWCARGLTGSRTPFYIGKRTDMYISTLRSHIEAMGGQLEVIARFPDGAVKISNFAEIGTDAS